MNSLKTIFDRQIEKFRDLKVKFDQIKHEQESFDYNGKLSELEQEKDKSLEEIEKNGILSDSVKKAARDAIEYEFLGKLDELEAEYVKFGELLTKILSERRELRSEPKYQEAIKVRSMAYNAKLSTEKLKGDRDSAKEQVAAAKERFEQAKKALEQAEQELEGSKKTLTSAKEALKSSKKAQEKVEAHYNEKIKDIIIVQEKIINTIISYITNGLDINEKDLTRPLDSIVKSKVYYSSGIGPKGGSLEDIESMVSIKPIDNVSLKAGDSIFVDCTFGTGEDKLTEKINIRITGDTTEHTNDNVKTPENTDEISDGSKLENTDGKSTSEFDNAVEKTENSQIETSNLDTTPTDSENIGTTVEEQEYHKDDDTNESTEKGKNKGKKKMTKREKELHTELNEATETIKQYILNINNNKIPFICFLKGAIEKSPVDEEIGVLLEKLANIYLNYHRDIDCLNLILNMNLPSEKMQKFIEYAHERSVEHGYNHKEFEDMKDLIKKLTNLKNNSNTAKKDKKDIGLQILGYIGTAFGVNMEVELGIADIGKSGHILAGICDGNAKRKKRKK